MKFIFKKINSKPKVGMFVALHGYITPESKDDLGIIVDIIKEPLGFNYKIYEFGDGKIYNHHISTFNTLGTKFKDDNFKYD